MKRVERLPDRSALPGYAGLVTEMALLLLAGGLECLVISGFVARLNDTLVSRILRWAETDLGPPPVPYAWLAFGSEGRMEQLLLTDQDNGIVYAEETPEARGYFQALAEKAVADLLAAGFPPCPGGYMATKWLGPVEEWTRRVQGWMDGPTPDALLEAAILFDLRRVHGSGPLDRLEEALSRAAKERALLASLAKAALGFKPPPGLLMRLRGESSRFNIKVQGISPVVALARCYGLEVGSASRHTLHRLRAAVAAGLIGEDVYATLSETYRFLLRLRLREQIRMAREGRPVGNDLSLSQLSSIERSQLKDAFRAIESWQEAAAFHYRAGYF
jgi:CBS domain-containing protein